MLEVLNEVARFLNVDANTLTEKKGDDVHLRSDVNISNLLNKKFTEVVNAELETKVKGTRSEFKDVARKEVFVEIEDHLKSLGAEFKAGEKGAWKSGVENLLIKTKQQTQTDEEAIKNSDFVKSLVTSYDSKLNEVETALMNERTNNKNDKLSRIELNKIRSYLKDNKDKLLIPEDDKRLEAQIKAIRSLTKENGIEFDLGTENDILVKKGGEVYKRNYNAVKYSDLLDEVVPVLLGVKDLAANGSPVVDTKGTTSQTQGTPTFKTEADFNTYRQTPEYKALKPDEKLKLISSLNKG